MGDVVVALTPPEFLAHFSEPLPPLFRTITPPLAWLSQEVHEARPLCVFPEDQQPIHAAADAGVNTDPTPLVSDAVEQAPLPGCAATSPAPDANKLIGALRSLCPSRSRRLAAFRAQFGPHPGSPSAERLTCVASFKKAVARAMANHDYKPALWVRLVIYALRNYSFVPRDVAIDMVGGKRERLRYIHERLVGNASDGGHAWDCYAGKRNLFYVMDGGYLLRDDFIVALPSETRAEVLQARRFSADFVAAKNPAPTLRVALAGPAALGPVAAHLVASAAPALERSFSPTASGSPVL